MIEQSITRKNYNSIDLFKIIMATFVIALHTSPLVNVDIPILKDIYSSIVSCAVPFFFLASGYLLANKFSENQSYDDRKIIITKYFKKIFKMYIFWSVVYLPLAIEHYINSNMSVMQSILSYFRSLIFIGEHHNSWMLWYLLSTIYSLIFILILNKKLSLKAITFIGLLFTILGFFLDYIDSISTLPYFLALINKAFRLTFSLGRIFKGMFFLPCGMILNKNKIPAPISLIGFLTFIVLNIFVNNYIINSIITVIYSVFLFCFIEKIKLKDSKVYPLIRNMSTYMYFIHMYVFVIFSKIVFKDEKSGMISFIGTTIISIIISYLIVKIKQRLTKKVTA